MMQDTYTPPPEVQRPTARPPAGAGANRWDRQRLLDAPFLFHQLMAQAQFKREAADPTPKRTRKRKPTVAAVIRQRRRQACRDRWLRDRPDGTVKVITGKPVGAIEIETDDTRFPRPQRSGIEMADITLDFVYSYRDPRNGKMRHQFRRKGCRKIMLKGRPGSAEFMDHYAELLAQSENAAAHVGASKIKPGSIDALIVKYLTARLLHQGTGQGDTGSAASDPRQLPPVHDAGWSPLW